MVREDLRLDVYVRQRFGALALVAEDVTDVEPPSDPEATAHFQELMTQWIAELRSRGDVVVQGLPGR
jgi:hypothetical protein